MFKVEREKGVYDTETKLPQSITTYGPGYIDKDNEVVVGLQTDAPAQAWYFSPRAVSVWWKTAWKLTVIISTR